MGGAGLQTAALCIGGMIEEDGDSTVLTQEYNGTAWSSGGGISVARSALRGAGTQAAGLCMGGVAGSYYATTEEYGVNYGSYDQLFSATGEL